MDERVIEPGLLRIFRNYCKFAICYFLGNYLYIFATTGELISGPKPALLIQFRNLLTFIGNIVLGVAGTQNKKIILTHYIVNRHVGTDFFQCINLAAADK